MASHSESNFQSDASLRTNRSEDDSFTSESDIEEDDEEYLEEVEVLITGLELLFRKQSLSDSYKTDVTDSSDESDSSMVSLEVDSLVLTRERLPHLRHKKTKFTRVVADDSEITGDYEVPLDMPLSGAIKRISETDKDTETTSSDDDWDSLTVDSLILTRRRFAVKKMSNPRRVDSLRLARRRRNSGKETRAKNPFDLKDDSHEVKQLHGHSKSHHVHYNTRLNQVFSIAKHNNGGFNCAA
jgi:hypothetical protein